MHSATAVKVIQLLGCIHKVITRYICDYTTVTTTCQAISVVLYPVLVLAIQRRFGQTGKGSKEGQEDDKRSGKPCSDERLTLASREPHPNIPIPRGWLQREQRLKGAT